MERMEPVRHMGHPHPPHHPSNTISDHHQIFREDGRCRDRFAKNSRYQLVVGLVRGLTEVVVACDRPCQFVIDPFLESRFASRFLSGLFAVRLDSSIPDAR